MSKVKLDISMSLDGFVAGPNPTLEDPLGKGGEQLHEWIFGLASWREPHGQDRRRAERRRRPPPRGPREHRRRDHGQAHVQRRRGPVGGRPERRRLVGRRAAVPRAGVRPHAPRARDRCRRRAARRSRSSPTGSSRRSSRRARRRATRTSCIAGGADVAQQYLKAGLLDEIQLHVAPLLLGGGVRLFDRPRPRRREARAGRGDRVAVGHPHQVPRPALAARRREVLVVRGAGPAAAPLPADRRERSHESPAARPPFPGGHSSGRDKRARPAAAHGRRRRTGSRPG